MCVSLIQFHHLSEEQLKADLDAARALSKAGTDPQVIYMYEVYLINKCIFRIPEPYGWQCMKGLYKSTWLYIAYRLPEETNFPLELRESVL